MVLILSAIFGLKSHQVDYTQAFPQAPLDDPIFMQIPQGSIQCNRELSNLMIESQLIGTISSTCNATSMATTSCLKLVSSSESQFGSSWLCSIKDQSMSLHSK